MVRDSCRLLHMQALEPEGVHRYITSIDKTSWPACSSWMYVSPRIRPVRAEYPRSSLTHSTVKHQTSNIHPPYPPTSNNFRLSKSLGLHCIATEVPRREPRLRSPWYPYRHIPLAPQPGVCNVAQYTPYMAFLLRLAGQSPSAMCPFVVDFVLRYAQAARQAWRVRSGTCRSVRGDRSLDPGIAWFWFRGVFVACDMYR
jgi:hypothetical protein